MFKLLRAEIIEAEAVGHGQDCAAALAQGHRPDWLRNIVGFHLRPIGRTVPDFHGRAIDPVEPLLLNVPQRTFAEVVPAVDQQAEVRHVGGPPGYRGTKLLAGAADAVEIMTLFVSRNSWIASMPLSRPRPDRFRPPNGSV